MNLLLYPLHHLQVSISFFRLEFFSFSPRVFCLRSLCVCLFVCFFLCRLLSLSLLCIASLFSLCVSLLDFLCVCHFSIFSVCVASRCSLCVWLLYCLCVVQSMSSIMVLCVHVLLVALWYHLSIVVVDLSAWHCYLYHCFPCFLVNAR